MNISLVNLISDFKSSGKGLMSEAQYISVANEINKVQPCNLLIFGLGEDSHLWRDINKDGQTFFLEDDDDWIAKFSNKNLNIYSVSYTTKAEDHKSINFNTDKLKMDLPEKIKSIPWDIIFVDGPLGHNPPRPYKGPGRMQSIYAAHCLLKVGGICIFDDMGRLIESEYSNHFFGSDNMYNLIEDKVGFFKKI